MSNSKKKERGKTTLLILSGIIMLFSFLLLRVWFPSKAVELAYEIDRLAAEKEALEEENRKFSLEIAKLKSPERISRIAKADLNMIRPSRVKVMTLERR